jgi:hypothetical protein
MSTAAAITWTPQDSKSALNPFFENAPFALRQCQRAGNIIALNSTLDMLGDCQRFIHSTRFRDLIHPEHRAEAEHLLAELFARQRDSSQIDSQTPTASSRPVRWTV